jgi:hypothetical protein
MQNHPDIGNTMDTDTHKISKLLSCRINLVSELLHKENDLPHLEQRLFLLKLLHKFKDFYFERFKEQLLYLEFNTLANDNF